MNPSRSRVQRPRRGSLLIGGGSLALLLATVLLAAYFVHVQDAEAESQTSGGAAADSKAPKAAPASKPAAHVSADFPSKPVELDFDGKQVNKTWGDLGVSVSPDGAVSVDRHKAEATLTALKPDLDRAPQNARMDLEHRKVYREKPGYGVDVFGSVSAIESAARSAQDHVELEGAPTPPTVTVKDLGVDDISTVLSTFETHFSVSEGSRNDNLKLLASHFDGYVMEPGQVFDFNKISGDRTEKEGYKTAHVILAGEMVDGMAGGSCQISTTLHGAAFFAGLDILASTPHSRPSTYVQLGLDATVVYPSVDLKLRNPYDFPVVIHYRVARGVARVEILGKEKPFDKIEFVREVKEEKPFQTVTREDDTLGIGHMVIDQTGFPGYTILRTRNIYKNRKVIKRNKWTLHYKPVIEYARIGTNPDPNLPPPKAKREHFLKPAKGSKFHMFR